MQPIAMVIDANQWEKLTGDEFDDTSMRKLVANIDKQLNSVVKMLKFQHCDVSEKGVFKCTPSLRAPGGRFATILRKVKEQGRKLDGDMELWLTDKLGE